MGQKQSSQGSGEESWADQHSNFSDRNFHSMDVSQLVDALQNTSLDPIEEQHFDPSYDFAIINDEFSKSYVQGSKVMILLRGLPGSGKSTLAEQLKIVYPNALVCSADKHFMNNGLYKFDSRKLPEAHKQCQSEASKACKSNTATVIIDNTNVKMWEMSFYINLANEMEYIVVVLEPKTSWKFSAEELAKKNTHGVNKVTLQKKLKDWDKVIPLYYGWFLNVADSQMLTLVGQAWFEQCLKIKEFYEDFKALGEKANIYDPLLYYSRSTFAKGTRMLHCTSKFCGRGKTANVQEYATKANNFVGKCFLLHVVGFVLTARSFGARIKLTDSEVPLWGQDDFEEDCTNNSQNPLPNKNMAQRSKSGVKVFARDTSTASLVCIPQGLDVAQNKFSPVEGYGSRAHITIGCAPNVKPVSTGFDVMKTVQLEQLNTQDKDSTCSYTLPGAVLRSFGDSFWVLYPDKQIVVSSVFSGHM